MNTRIYMQIIFFDKCRTNDKYKLKKRYFLKGLRIISYNATLLNSPDKNLLL